MRKICIVTGNRADYSRLKSVISAVGENPDLELILIASASHLLDDFGKTINNIKKDGWIFPPPLFNWQYSGVLHHVSMPLIGIHNFSGLVCSS